MPVLEGKKSGPASTPLVLTLLAQVSSTVTAMKSDLTGYEYDPSASSRLNCRMIPFGPQSYGMGVDAYQYRHNSLSSFQFSPSSVKPYYSLPQYSDFADDYDINGSPYPLLPNDSLAIPSYTTSSTGRGWATPTPQLPKTSLYLEQQDSAYSHGQLPYHSGDFSLRPAISPEPKSLSMHGLTTSLPTTANDRLLPVPAANRQSASFMRAADGFLAVSQPSFAAYDGLMSASVLTSLKNHSNSTGHNPSYMSTMSSSSSESHNSNSSQIAYSSGPILSSQSHEMYPQSGDNYTSGESPDSAYGPSSPVSKQNSQNALPLHSEDHLREPYRVPPYQQSHAPAPPIESPAPTRHTGATISAL